VGDKGQVVIPVEARKELGIDKGDKLIVFGHERGVLVLVEASRVGEWVSLGLDKLSRLSSMLEQPATPTRRARTTKTGKGKG
jgi:AbrB family looped-hinge helix DNA binding protein